MNRGRVYKAINAVSADLARCGIPKAHVNLREQYQYRSIDDLLETLAPLLATHGLCVLPKVLKRTEALRSDSSGGVRTVVVKVAYDLVCVEDGSRHSLRSFGEAIDECDKATAKALTAAYKAAMIQAFCIPHTGSEDGDSVSRNPVAKVGEAEPIQGWVQWSSDLISMLELCESDAALERLQNSHRAHLNAISRARPDLYRGVGEAFTRRFETLAQLQSSKLKKPRPRRTPGTVVAEAEHA